MLGGQGQLALEKLCLSLLLAFAHLEYNIFPPPGQEKTLSIFLNRSFITSA